MGAATGMGVSFCLERFMDSANVAAKAGIEPGIAGKTITLQGFGNVGKWSARFLSAAGAKITSIIERDCGIHNPDGIDIEEASAYYAAHGGSFRGFPKATTIDDTASMLAAETDIPSSPRSKTRSPRRMRQQYEPKLSQKRRMGPRRRLLSAFSRRRDASSCLMCS